MGKKEGKIGVVELMGYGIGNCIGSGLFVSMGMGIAFTGRSIPLALIAANIVVLFAYAFRTLMAGMFVLPGGWYSQQVLLQPPLLVGVTAVAAVLSSFSYAMYAKSIIQYASAIFPGIMQYERWIALAIISVFFVTTFFGPKFIAAFNLMMVVIMIVSLVTYCAVGLPMVQPGAFAVGEPGYFSGGAFGFVTAIACMAFACQGATMPVQMTADARNPKRDLPVSILLTTLVITVFYFLVALVSGGVLPVEQVANQNLSVVAGKIFPYPVFVIFVLGGACFAIATSLYTYIVAVQYPLLATIQDGWLPKQLGAKTKGGYPWAIMLLLYAVSTIPLFLDMGLDVLISYLTIPTMIINTLNNLLVLPLVNKYPEAWENGFFRMPKAALYVVVGVSVLCDILISVALFTTIDSGSQIGMLSIMAALFIYSAYRLKSGKVDLQTINKAKSEAEQAARK